MDAEGQVAGWLLRPTCVLSSEGVCVLCKPSEALLLFGILFLAGALCWRRDSLCGFVLLSVYAKHHWCVVGGRRCAQLLCNTTKLTICGEAWAICLVQITLEYRRRPPPTNHATPLGVSRHGKIGPPNDHTLSCLQGGCMQTITKSHNSSPSLPPSLFSHTCTGCVMRCDF